MSHCDLDIVQRRGSLVCRDLTTGATLASRQLPSDHWRINGSKTRIGHQLLLDKWEMQWRASQQAQEMKT